MIHERCGENTQRPIPDSVTSASDYVGPRRLALSVLRSSISLSPVRITQRARKRDAALPCSWFLTESPVWLILENETRRDLLVRVFLRKRETRKYGYIVTKKRKCSEDPTSSQATEKGNRERERERESRAEQSRAEGYFGRRSIGRGRSTVRAM